MVIENARRGLALPACRDIAESRWRGLAELRVAERLTCTLGLALGERKAGPWTPVRAGITRSTRAGSATRKASGARRRRTSTGSKSPKRCSIPKAGIYGRWFVGGVCNTCFNAVDRHVDAGRGDQAAIIYDSPLAGAEAHHHLPSPADRDAGARRHAARPRRRQGRPRHPLHADGAGGGDRHARLRAHRRHPFGRVRRLCGARTGDPHRRRQAEGDSFGELRHRARPRRRLQAAARRGDRALARTSPTPA